MMKKEKRKEVVIMEEKKDDNEKKVVENKTKYIFFGRKISFIWELSIRQRSCDKYISNI